MPAKPFLHFFTGDGDDHFVATRIWDAIPRVGETVVLYEVDDGDYDADPPDLQSGFSRDAEPISYVVKGVTWCDALRRHSPTRCSLSPEIVDVNILVAKKRKGRGSPK